MKNSFAAKWLYDCSLSLINFISNAIKSPNGATAAILARFHAKNAKNTPKTVEYAFKEQIDMFRCFHRVFAETATPFRSEGEL